MARTSRLVLLAISASLALSAAPQLRLKTAALGPISIPTGSDGPAQSVLSYNIGDGDLTLTATSNASWLAVSVGDLAPCALRSSGCYNLSIALQTASLAKGSYTGLITVADPNAIDAPQTISVTIRVGGAFPDQADFFVPPGGSQELVIPASSRLGTSATTESGGDWLSIPLEAGGSFRFTYNYHLAVQALSDLAEGVYKGAVTILGSAIPDENKTIPVSMTVTSGPIAAQPDPLAFRLAEGALALPVSFSVSNRGAGTLELKSVQTLTTDGASWLSAELRFDEATGLTSVAVLANPAGLAQGQYFGSVAIETNAANSPLVVPVSLDVSALGAPTIDYGSITNFFSPASTFTPTPGMILRLRGTQLSSMEPFTAEAPYPDTLAGVRVLVNGAPASLFSVRADEIVFQVPTDAQPGPALLQVERDGTPGNQVSFNITDRAPFLSTLTGKYAWTLTSAGLPAIPEELGGLPATAGDNVAIFATGLGLTDPFLSTGAAIPDPAPIVNERVTVLLGSNGIQLEATASLDPNHYGLYIVTFAIPEGLPADPAAPLTLLLGSASSNTLRIALR